MSYHQHGLTEWSNLINTVLHFVVLAPATRGAPWQPIRYATSLFLCSVLRTSSIPATTTLNQPESATSSEPYHTKRYPCPSSCGLTTTFKKWNLHHKSHQVLSKSFVRICLQMVLDLARGTVQSCFTYKVLWKHLVGLVVYEASRRKKGGCAYFRLVWQRLRSLSNNIISS